MSLNLMDTLTLMDKKKIENYIRLYGGCGDEFIGLDQYLSQWAAAKVKLYKLLGNQLQVKVPFSIKKDISLEEKEIDSILKKHSFVDEFDNFYTSNFFGKDRAFNYEIFGKPYGFMTLVSHAEWFQKNEIPYKMVVTRRADDKKIVFSKGARPTRVLGKLVEFFGKEHFPSFDSFINELSVVKNDSYLKGNLVLSIHPLDFMTMSDNASGWSSCMSWTDSGCFRAGTVEMLNSNNVLCCYLESSKPFIFCNEEGEEEECTWNNKKWRQLLYVTKDIIVAGKSYPYSNKEITHTLLNCARELAQKNIGWTYFYGPQLYRDMKHIRGSKTMSMAHYYIKANNMKKKNIIFESKAMYNDMLNDNDYNYWCVRNKVEHNKIISYSGKALCLTCGDALMLGVKDASLIDDFDGYNERYGNCDTLICSSCKEEGECTRCRSYYGKGKLIEVKSRSDTSEYVCKKCCKEYYRKCPCCGDVFELVRYYPSFYIKACDERLYIQDLRSARNNPFWKKNKVIPAYTCNSCSQHFSKYYSYSEAKINNSEIQKVIEELHIEVQEVYKNPKESIYGWESDVIKAGITRDIYHLEDESIQKFLCTPLEI